MQVDPQDPTRTALAVGGTLANDKIQILKQGNHGEIKFLLDREVQGVFQPTGRILAFGQAGDDHIQVTGSIELATWLFGVAGNDHLNGGDGPNVHLGGLGDETLIGGSNRDLLVGGFGQDRLIGNGGDDILIGGELGFTPLVRTAAIAAIQV